MNSSETAINLIFDPSIPFEVRCSNILQFQYDFNPVYKRFIESLGYRPSDMLLPDEVQLLPIRGFKDGKIMIESDKKPDLIFKSSGTSDMKRSTHYILDQHIYGASVLNGFKRYFPFDTYTVLFYLPGYDQNPQSSLIWMAKHLIQMDPSAQSRFVSLNELDSTLSELAEKDKKILLFGAAFGLMDIIESNNFEPIDSLEILETGGMKTYRREMSKPDLHQALSCGFGIPLDHIHSEYGMCELLSQCYSISGEWLNTPHWVHVNIRDPKDPSRICDIGEEGKIGVIDLANIYSCPFILTGDRGVKDHSGRFKVLGRWNPKDLRGCNFLIDNE